jgi:hypothetical protein
MTIINPNASTRSHQKVYFFDCSFFGTLPPVLRPSWHTRPYLGILDVGLVKGPGNHSLAQGHRAVM